MNQQQADQSQKTFPCPQCGAQLSWDPMQGIASCQFCGYKQTVQSQPQAQPQPQAAGQPSAQVQPAAQPAIEEHDLMAFLAQASQAKPQGLGTATKTITCRNCGAMVSVEPHITSTECAFCGSNMVIEQPANETLIRPESLLPLQIDKNSALKTYKDWLGKGWFKPGDLKDRASKAKLYGVYLPFWTFDAQVNSSWSAMAGYYYYVTETYYATENGRQVQKTRQVRKIRWEPARGYHDAFYDDVLVHASLSVEPKMLERIYPYDTTRLVPYDPRYLAGWEAEQYRIDLKQGWGSGRQKMTDSEYKACESLVPGDTHKDLSVSSSFSRITFKHVLLPLWISSYKYKGKVFRFLVNGQTGKIHGEKPISWIKVTLAILFGLILAAVIAGLVYYFTQ